LLNKWGYMDFSDLKNKKALVIDDFENVRKSIKGMLLELGFQTVTESYDGNTATKAMTEAQYDLILCDFNLGKGRDGLRLLEEWRSKKMMAQSAIFVLITGETSREIVVSALEFQPDDYLAKPFTMDVLSKRLGRWFERRQVLLPLLVSMEKDDWEAVGQSSRQIIEDHPRYRSAAQKQYVEALIQQNQLTEAENFLHGLLDKRYQSWAQTALHRIDLIQNKLEAAEAGLKKVIQRDPNDLEAYDYLAKSLAIQKKDEELQEWVEMAVSRAPRNIDRQKHLVKVTQRNFNYQRGNQAFKEIINLSNETMHESIDTYQQYIKSLQHESRVCEEGTRKKDIQKEISNTSKRMSDRYSNNPNPRIFNKALTVHNSGEAAAHKFTKPLNELFALCFDVIDEIIPDTALFVAETYYLAERYSDADELVRQFRIKFKTQPNIIKQLDDLQEEPGSLPSSKEEAKALNMKGIELYKEKQYLESIEFFKRAMTLSPRHPGIILNFVQSHLLRMKTEGTNPPAIEECLSCIDRLNYLPNDHYQYERYSKLKQNLKSLK